MQTVILISKTTVTAAMLAENGATATCQVCLLGVDHILAWPWSLLRGLGTHALVHTDAVALMSVVPCTHTNGFASDGLI